MTAKAARSRKGARNSKFHLVVDGGPKCGRGGEIDPDSMQDADNVPETDRCAWCFGFPGKKPGRPRDFLSTDRTIDALLQSGSRSAAADALSISLSALSRRLQSAVADSSPVPWTIDAEQGRIFDAEGGVVAVLWVPAGEPSRMRANAVRLLLGKLN